MINCGWWNMEKKKKIFVCSFCGTQIKSNRANLPRKYSQKKIEKIKCAVEVCKATFKEKSDYFNHWKNFHSSVALPDGFTFITENSTGYRKKFRENFRSSMDLVTPIDFQLLNYLGLMEKTSKNITLVKPQPGFFYGKLDLDDSD